MRSTSKGRVNQRGPDAQKVAQAVTGFSTSLMNDLGNYGARKVARTQLQGFTISTAFTSDEGFETAVLDKNGAHPVERYDDKHDAIAGHDRWTAMIEDGQRAITKLGGWGVVGDQEIKLEPRP